MMKIIRKISAETAAKNLEKAASEKFVANEMASSCLCRCSDGSDDRQKCLNECIRVTKAKGIIAFAYISPYSVFPCVLRGNLSRISKELMKKIVDDKKISSDDSCCFWTDNYFYSPDDIEIWLKNNDLIIEDHLASDGQSIAFQTVVNSMNDSEFEIWLEYHRKTCRIPSLLGASNHGLIITRKKV